MDNYQEVIRRIRALIASGYIPDVRRQADLAYKLGQDPGNVSRWLNGKKAIGHKTLARIAEALNTTPDYLEGKTAIIDPEEYRAYLAKARMEDVKAAFREDQDAWNFEKSTDYAGLTEDEIQTAEAAKDTALAQTAAEEKAAVKSRRERRQRFFSHEIGADYREEDLTGSDFDDLFEIQPARYVFTDKASGKEHRFTKEQLDALLDNFRTAYAAACVEADREFARRQKILNQIGPDIKYLYRKAEAELPREEEEDAIHS